MPLCLAGKKIGINATVHELPDNYKGSKIKFYKRHHWRKTLKKQVAEVMQERDPSNTVFFASQMPTLNPPVLKGIAGHFPTVMDIRDIWQEHLYHPFIKRKIEQWEQISTMNKVDIVTYTHAGFYEYLVNDIKDRNKLRFLSLAANKDIFTDIGKKKTLSDREVNLIWTGSLSFDRSFPVLLKIMKRLQDMQADVYLTIIGDGKKASWLQQQITNYRLQNTLFYNEWLPQEQLAEYIRSADYSVFMARSDGILHDVAVPTKVFEALCSGTPVLSFAGLGMRNFNHYHRLSKINKNIDYLADNLSIDDMCNKIISMPSVRNDIRKKLSVLSESFSYQNVALEFKRILQEVL